MEFNDCLKVILKFEGGYDNDPNDHGGATNFGITQRVYDSYKDNKDLPHQSVKNILSSEVSDIYFRNYWLDGKCDKLPLGLNLLHFDACVNCGIHQAALFLQRSVGVEADGKIGPITVRAANAQDTVKSINRYHAERIEFYMRLVHNNESQRKFQNGWNHRADRCKTIALEELAKWQAVQA